MLLTVHKFLTQMFDKIDDYMGGIGEDRYKALQASLFLFSAIGAVALVFAAMLQSWPLLSFGILSFIVPSIWDRIQFFLITS